MRETPYERFFIALAETLDLNADRPNLANQARFTEMNQQLAAVLREMHSGTLTGASSRFAYELNNLTAWPKPRLIAAANDILYEELNAIPEHVRYEALLVYMFFRQVSDAEYQDQVRNLIRLEQRG